MLENVEDGIAGQRGYKRKVYEETAKPMREGGYFEEALADFASEAAYVGAVKHLYDLGYSVERIRKELLYPVSVQQIEKVIEAYEAEKGSPEQDYEYIRDIGQYGKQSFRRVKKTEK